ncbi:hypothetical protein AT15_05905 [Kosmotoga arenicorallina S304]|uniref:HD-GYP domain-containing protein n=1 Tax=Kosmotoga arenicorallina S304 TaxID=1453497 RepID=A0A182C7L0_9BACT|nr:HD-GYP domain-containing protein [Kosmotoga arenicorallina]OAA31604.1 hypothetical protein AT15_05905 [Kosmotoga arenicorallina S304]
MLGEHLHISSEFMRLSGKELSVLKVIVEALPYAVFGVYEGRIVAASDSILRAIGAEEFKEIENKFLNDFLSTPIELPDRCYEPFEVEFNSMRGTTFKGSVTTGVMTIGERSVQFVFVSTAEPFAGTRPSWQTPIFEGATESLMKTLNTEKLCKTIHHYTEKISGCRTSFIFVLDSRSQELSCLSARINGNEVSPEHFPAISLYKNAEEEIAYAVRTGEIIYIPDCNLSLCVEKGKMGIVTTGLRNIVETASFNGFQAHSVLIIPLKIRDVNAGAILILCNKINAIERTAVSFLEVLSKYVAYALNNSLVHQKTKIINLKLQELLSNEKMHANGYQQSIINLAEITSSFVEKKDPYTVGHQKRVAKLSKEIARELGLSPSKIRAIEFAASIHDIGKIEIPESVLLKSGKLNSKEFNMIKHHPEVGYTIAHAVNFPWSVDNTILHHHERLNGSGYPEGLKGKSIEEEAKILAVADVMEAMTHDRPYRKAMSYEEALSEIEKKSNTLYEGEIVKACEKLFDEGFKFQ